MAKKKEESCGLRKSAWLIVAKSLRPRVFRTAGYLGIPITTLYAWTLGRRKPFHREEFYPSVLEFVDRRTHLLSFFDLVEAHILRAAIDKNVPLNMKRPCSLYGINIQITNARCSHFSSQTDGKHLLVGGMLGAREGQEGISKCFC